MKLTKGMKKALSLLLSGALVITGVNVTTTAADAAEAKNVTIKVQNQLGNFTDTETTWDDTDANYDNSVNVTEVGDYEVTITDIAEARGFFNTGFFEASSEDAELEAVSVNMKSLVINDSYELKYVADYSDLQLLVDNANGLANIWNPEGKADKVAESEDGTAVLAGIGKGAGIEFQVNGTATTIEKLTYKFEVTKLEFKSVEEADPTDAPSETTSGGAVTTGGAVDPTPGAGDVTTKKNVQADSEEYAGSMEKFSVYMNYVSDEQYGEQGWDYNEVVVEKDGEYTVDWYAGVDTDDIFLMILGTNLKDGSVAKGFKLAATKVTIGDKEYTLDDQSGYWRFSDDKRDKPYRYNIKNPWNGLIGDDLTAGDVGDVHECDAFKGAKVAVKKGDTITVTFTVSGMDPKAETPVIWPPIVTDNPNPTATAPATSPAATVTPGAVTPGAATAAAATKKIKPAKSSVVIAAGKSKTVKFTTTVAAPATKAAAVKATIAKKAVVSKAKVSGKKVKITAAKKATKGASTTVTLKSTNAAGKVVSAKIKVYIQNKAKKVKAAKKSVTVKKGKKVKVTLKVTAQNKKKATTDTVKVASNKLVKLAKSSAKKGKVVVTLKGKKKGTKKVTIKVGSKKVKVKVKVK